MGQIELSSIKLIEGKTWTRFNLFLAKNDEINPNVDIIYEGIKLPSLKEMVKKCINLALKIKPSPGISHGDFCLSNILFDSRSDRLKVIDPRGLDGGGRKLYMEILTTILRSYRTQLLGLMIL